MARLTPMRSTADVELVEAARPGLHRTHIALLAQSRHRQVREAVAGRDDVPLGIQAALANDDWHEVRAAIAVNPRAARSVMEALGEDRHHEVVLALLDNPSLPYALAERLAFHKRPDVRLAAAVRLDALEPDAEIDERQEDHLVPELRERATAWVEAERADDANAPVTTLGAAARAAAAQDQRHDDAVHAAAQAFEPGAQIPFDDTDPYGATADMGGHGFLVVTIPDDLGPSRAEVADSPFAVPAARVAGHARYPVAI